MFYLFSRRIFISYNDKSYNASFCKCFLHKSCSLKKDSQDIKNGPSLADFIADCKAGQGALFGLFKKSNSFFAFQLHQQSRNIKDSWNLINRRGNVYDYHHGWKKTAAFRWEKISIV